MGADDHHDDHGHSELTSEQSLKVAAIFMGGGTTLVEGSRLGMPMYGAALNPAA